MTDLSGFLPTLDHSRFTLDGAGVRALNADSNAFAQRGRYRGRGRRGGGHDGSRAALVLGAMASVTGAAVLVYANRPDCRTNQRVSGCGYGTKVIGGAVLTGGAISFLAGALSW